MTVSPAARRFVRLALVLMLALGALPMGAFADELPAAPVATTLTLIAGASGTGSPAQVTGHLTDAIGTPIADAAIALESSTDTVSWTSADALTTNASGDFSGSRAVGRTTYFRASYAGLADAYAASASDVATSAYAPAVAWTEQPAYYSNVGPKLNMKVAVGVLGADDASCTGVFRLVRSQDDTMVVYAMAAGHKSVDTVTGQVVFSASASVPKSGLWRVRFELKSDAAHEAATAETNQFYAGDTYLSISASTSTVKVGSAVTISGRIKGHATRTGIRGLTVKLESSSGGGKWSKVASKKSGSGGKVSFRPHPTRRTSYRLVFHTTTKWIGGQCDPTSVSTYFKLTANAAKDFKSNKVYLKSGFHTASISGVGMWRFYLHSQDEKRKREIDIFDLQSEDGIDVGTSGYYHFRVTLRPHVSARSTRSFTIKIYN